jgi:hypothetical protein
MALQLVARSQIYKLRVHQKIKRLCIPVTDIPPRAIGEPANTNGRGPVP